MRTLLMLVLVLGCSTTEPGAAVYGESFESGAAGWIQPLTHLAADPANGVGCFTSWAGKRSCEVPLPVESGAAVTRSPWWLDTAHEAPEGAGTLLLLSAFRLHGEDHGQNVGDLDLLNATITARVKVDSLNLPGDSHVYFWFQTEDPVTGVRANYVLLDRPLDMPKSKRGTWYEWTAALTADANWQCLGSSAARDDLYGCFPVGDALHHVTLDFGLIAFPALRPRTFPDDPNAVGSGAIRIDWIEIRH